MMTGRRVRVMDAMQQPAHAFLANRLSPSGAQVFAARNLELLAAIENTLDALAADSKLLAAIHDSYSEIGERLQGRTEAIDPDSRIAATLTKASDACARIHRDVQARHRSACADPQLHPDDGVADAFEQFMDAVTSLHDTIEVLREWIATHDATLEPTTGAVYDNVDDLFAALLPSQ